MQAHLPAHDSVPNDKCQPHVIEASSDEVTISHPSTVTRSFQVTLNLESCNSIYFAWPQERAKLVCLRAVDGGMIMVRCSARLRGLYVRVLSKVRPDCKTVVCGLRLCVSPDVRNTTLHTCFPERDASGAENLNCACTCSTTNAKDQSGVGRPAFPKNLPRLHLHHQPALSIAYRILLSIRRVRSTR